MITPEEKLMRRIFDTSGEPDSPDDGTLGDVADALYAGLATIANELERLTDAINLHRAAVVNLQAPSGRRF